MVFMYNFDDIKGNEQIIKNFKSMIFNNKIAHAFIIDAPRGCGKKLIASAFAKAVQCENSRNKDSEKEVGACGKCVSCRTFDSGNHMEVIYVNSSKGKSIGVDDIREQIGKNIDLKPYKYQYKIFIIDAADTMTIQAQNAILKTIEEPPSYGVFLLLSENCNNLLPTILSRCVIFKLKPLSEEIVLDYITHNLDIGYNEASVFAAYAQGNIGKAIEIASSEKFINIRNMVFDFIRDFDKKDIVDIFLEVSFFEEYKEDIMTVLDILYLCYHDIIVLKTLSDRFIVQKDKKVIFKNSLDYFSLEQLFFGTNAIISAKRQLAGNANFQMTIENLLLKLREKR